MSFARLLATMNSNGQNLESLTVNSIRAYLATILNALHEVAGPVESFCANV